VIDGRILQQLLEELAELVAERFDVSAAAAVEGEPWRLLNLEEAAARLGRSERWVRERVKRGDLPHVRLDGGALAFELDDLRAFAEARRVSASEARALPDCFQDGRGGCNGAGLRGDVQPRRLRVDER
jgi:excisionase family DNA binding protein